MNQCNEATKLRQQFKKNNTKNYVYALIGKVIFALMTVSLSLLLTFFIEAVEYKSMEKLAMGFGVCCIYLVANLATSMFRRKYQNIYLRDALTQFKNYVFEKILKQPISNYASGNTGKFISAFSNDLNSIEQHYLIGELNLFVELISYIITSAYLLFMNLELGLILIVSSLIAIAISFGFGKKVVKHETESSEKASSFVSQTKDLLSGFAVIKSFKAEKEIMGVFSKKNVDLESTKQQRRASNDTVSIVSNISSVVVSFLFMSAGFWLAFNGRVSVGIIIGFYEISGNMLSPIRSLGTLFSNRRAANALIDRIGADLENTYTCNTPKSELLSAPQEIVLNQLSYGYSENHTVLDAVTHRFESGKSYALVGASGSGKSTLLKILMGFAPNYSGAAKYGNIELKDIDPEQLLEYISIIQQDVFCFNSSIEDNITMFRSFPKEELEVAVHNAGLSELCAVKGNDYLCGEGGCNLSGGERQRVSIARCFLRKTPIILVDEAEAALDNETANAVLQTILNMKDTMRIVVTHRLDAPIMRQYDEILVLHNGQIEECGTFDELIEQKGHFYSLYRISQ